GGNSAEQPGRRGGEPIGSEDRAMGGTNLATWVDRQGWLDTAAEALQRGVGRAFEALGPVGLEVKNALHGTWLGPPLHPVLTDLPLGAWTATMVLDAMAEETGSAGVAQASDAALALGLAGAVGAAATGIADWKETDARPRRLGLAHAALNVGATLLFAGSFVCRRTRNRPARRAPAPPGYPAATAAAH